MNEEEANKPIISFPLVYPDAPVFCEAVMEEDHFKIYFNGKFMGNLELNENTLWVMSEGTILPQDVIEQIGAHIEGHLD